jgi:hypothetical protein
MPAIRTQFPELFQLSLDTQTQLALLDELTDMSFDEQPGDYEDIFNVMDGTGTGKSDTAVGGFGLPQEAENELAGLHYDNQGRWFPQHYIYTTFNLGYIVSHDIQADDKWDLAGQRARWFGRSFRRLPDVMAARLFNEGFATTTQSGVGNLGRRSPDGKALFATDHPNPGPGGGTQANRPAGGGADLAHSSLEAMMIRMGNRTDDRGMPVNIPMKTLYLPWALYPRGLEIVNSSFRTDTLNRVKNVIPNVMMFDIKKSFYLSNARAYFGVGPKGQTGLKWLWRERFTRNMWKDNETRAIHVGGWVRYDYGYSHYFGLDGDPGLGG